MSPSLQSLAALALATGLALAPMSPRAERTARPVPDFTVFVDPPTGFVFVKLPAGWKFVGQTGLARAAALPANVVTTLLEGPDDDSGPRLSQAADAR